MHLFWEFPIRKGIWSISVFSLFLHWKLPESTRDWKNIFLGLTTKALNQFKGHKLCKNSKLPLVFPVWRGINWIEGGGGPPKVSYTGFMTLIAGSAYFVWRCGREGVGFPSLYFLGIFEKIVKVKKKIFFGNF